MASGGSGGSSVPRIRVFRPTMEEFKNFSKYIEKIESEGAHKAGLAKIIPPEGWTPRKKGYNDIDLIIPSPITQVVNGRQGLYQQYNIQRKALTVKEFKKLAEGSKYMTPSHFDYEDLERKYWKNIAFNSPIYGADVSGSLYDAGVKEFNIQHLNTILDLVKEDYEIQIEGVNTAYLYFGMWKTTFAWHTEDMDLYSINYLHFGAPKSWYAIPPEHGRRLERLAANFFHGSSNSCSAFLRHKMTIISPQILKQYSIPYNKITQEPGEFMITFPFGYHSGFNHGFNCAESTNFAMPRWIEYGKRATSCTCRNDCVKICMDMFVRKFQPDRYELWKVGKDIGAHPEEPTKQYAAPAPKKIDLALAAQRERKRAKLLEASHRIKRLPISKLSKHHAKYDATNSEIQDEDSGSEATEIYDMASADNESRECKSPPHSVSLFERVTELEKQPEVYTSSDEGEKEPESQPEMLATSDEGEKEMETANLESFSDENVTSDDEAPVFKHDQPPSILTRKDISTMGTVSSRQLPSLRPFWDQENAQRKSLDEQILSQFPILREGIQRGTLALTLIPPPSFILPTSYDSPYISSRVTLSPISSPRSTSFEIAEDSPQNMTSPLALVESHMPSPSTSDQELKHKTIFQEMSASTAEKFPPSSNWKCQKTQGLKVRLAKESQRKRIYSETASSTCSSSETSFQGNADSTSIQTQAALPPHDTSPAAPPIIIPEMGDGQVENANGQLEVQGPKKPTNERESKNKKDHKRRKAGNRNVRAADDCLGNWARPILRLWQHYPYNFEEEQKFNIHCSTIDPHCAVCVIFSPCNVANGYPNLPIEVPANSKVKMPSFCFGNGLDNQMILDSNPLLSRDGTSPLLVCSMCKVCVHAACYGVTMLQMGSWTCARCSSSAVYEIECCLCVMRGGALKPTDDGRWAHIICAILIPETYFDDVILKEPINLSRLTVNRQRLKCKYCFKSLHNQSTKRGACVQCLSGKCYLPFHVTCGYMAGVIYDVSDWPEPLNISCTAHSRARRKPTKRIYTNIEVEDKVLARHKKNKRYYWVDVRQIYNQEFYSILFEDNSTSTNTLPDDIVYRETKKKGCPNINEKVKVKWTDGIVYNAIFKGSRSCKIYVIEFDDGTLITQERHQIYASDETIPKEILSKVGTSAESRVGSLYKPAGEGKRVRISNSKYKSFES